MKRYKLNGRRLAGSVAVMLMVLCSNIIVYWMLTEWVFAR